MQLRNQVFNTPYKNYGDVGVDLFVLDVMRSRDCGHESFTKYLQRLFNVNVQSWKDIESYFEPKALALLQKYYLSVFDIELYVGLALGKPTTTSPGPEILAKQFYQFKFADRLFYSNRENPYPFTNRKLLHKH